MFLASLHFYGGQRQQRKTRPRSQMEFDTAADTPITELCQVRLPKLSKLIAQQEAHTRKPTPDLVLFYGVCHRDPSSQVEVCFCWECAKCHTYCCYWVAFPSSHSY